MAELLAHIAERRGGVPALIDEFGETTWADFNARVNRLIHALRSAGLPPGSTLAVLSGNRREYYELVAACMHSWLDPGAGQLALHRRGGALRARERRRPGLLRRRALRGAGRGVGDGAFRAGNPRPRRRRACAGLRGLRGDAGRRLGAGAGGPGHGRRHVLHVGHHRPPQGRARQRLGPVGGSPRHHGAHVQGLCRHARPARGRRHSLVWTLLPLGPVGVLHVPAGRRQHRRDAPQVRRGGDPGTHRPLPRHQPPSGAHAARADAQARREDACRLRRFEPRGRLARRGALPQAREGADDRVVGADHHRVLRGDGGRDRHPDQLRGVARTPRQRRQSRSPWRRSASSTRTASRVLRERPARST